ncbi:unnamed protein product, partial [Ectocarpus sp. 13 AM-2016]
MPAEAEHASGDARKRTVAVAEFAEFVHALQEFHSKADHDVLDALRVANNGRVGRVFSEADAHVLEIGGASGAGAPAIPVADSPPPSPLVVAAPSPAPSKVEEARLPPRSSRRGKLRVRDSNVSTASQQETAAAAAAAAATDRGKRQRTAVGKKDSGGAAAVPPSAQDEAEVDKENQPAAAVAKGRGRPPLPKRKKLGGGTANPADADGSGPKAEPVRRSGRNSGLPPEPTEGSRPRGGSIARAPNSSRGGGCCTQNKCETGDNGDSSSSGDVAAAEIAELRAIKVSSMKVVDLRAALRKLGSSAGGLKAVLQVRLEETIAARVSELETPPQTIEGDQEEREQEEQRDAPAAGAAARSEDASTISGLPSTRSSVAPGAALGPLTRLSMPRLSAESVTVPSPVRASPFFGNDSEQQQQQQQQQASTAVAVAAAAAVGVGGALEGASGAPESGGGGDGDHGVEDLMDIDSEKLESDDDSGDDIEGMETDTSKIDQRGVPVGEAAAARSAREEDVPKTGASGDMEESEGEGGADPPLSPVPDAGSGVPARAAAADSDTLPVAEDVTEIVPEVTPVDVSSNMVDEEDEEEAEEGEVVLTAEDRKGLADEAAPEESGSPSGTAVEGGAKVECEAAGAGDVSAKGMAVEEERPSGEAAMEDEMDVEEPRSEEGTPKDIFAPPALEDKPVGYGSVSSSSGTQSFPCKTPGSAAVSRSSTSLLSSGGSSITNLPRNDSGVGPAGGSGGDIVGGKRARPIAAQETPGSAAGSAVSSSVGRSGGGGGGGGGKRPKTGKEKVSLQEIMSQMRKTYAKKGGTPGAASKAGNAGARKAAADFTATRKPEVAAATAPAAVPVAAAVPSTPVSKSDARSEAAVVAAAEAPPAPAATGSTSAEPAAPSAAAAAAAGKPSNLITTLHSFTSVLSKKNAAAAAAAPLGKWDRLAAGTGASSNARTVPALRKAEEARLLEERRARERATSRVRTQAGGGATVAAAAGKQQLEQLHAASASAARSQGERVTPGGAMARVGAAKAFSTQAAAAGSKSAGVPDGKAVSSAGTGGAPSQPHLAPLRVTGMLSKLVPGGVAGPVGLGTEETALPPSSRKVSDLSSSDLPEPFRRSEDLFVGGAAAAAAAAAVADCDNASVRSAGSTSSSCFSMGVSSTAGGRPSSTVSSSERVEKKIRDQRAKIALKRQARMEKIKAEEARKKAELETKELRDAARLEASRRAKQEAEARLREQKAQRQAEVEHRREQERADKEAKDARERQEKEARRLAAMEEAKAKAAQEGAAIKAQQARKLEPAAVAAVAAPAAASTIAGATAAEGKPVAVLKRVSPAAAPASST